MPFESTVLLIVSVINLLLVVLIRMKAKHSLANKLFMLAIFCNVGWSFGTALLFGANSESLINIGSILFFISPLFTAYFLLIFTEIFLENKTLTKKDFIAIIPTVVLSVVILLNSGFLVKDLVNSDINTFTVNKVPYAIYGLYFSVYFGLSYLVLYVKSRNKEGREKIQLRYMLAAAIMSSFLALITNVVLPFIKTSEYIWLGPIFTLFYVIIIMFAIVKHSLFDFRATIARVIAYVGSIASIGGLYVLVIFILSGNDLLSSNLSNFQRLVYATIAVLSGLLFQPFKQFFDKVTNKIFYRDSYDAQVLIDELNKNLVNSVELEELLTKSALIIQENLKVQFTTFFIRETSYFPDRIIGAHRKDPEIEDLDRMQEIAPKIRKKVLYVGDNGDSEQEKELSQILQRNDIEVVARLVNTLDFEVKGIGYLLIGAKKSGSDYTKQDLKVIEIVANELVIATENALRLEEIEQFNVTLQKKIDDATKELKQTNQKLLALDEAKDEFVSMASHQLRTPLTSIKGYLSMVLEGDAGKINDTQKEMLGQAFFSSQRMVYLIADLLNVSRLKTGKFIIETKPVYLPDVVESEISQLQEGAAAKNLKLTFDKPQSFPTLNLDEMKIRQVVMNFSDNAIYYTPSGGKITVELKETPKAVEFRVKDSGIGVPKDEQHKLFTKFYRAENARKTRPDGTGLGIFMAKKVVVAQGGSIIFESKEGKGSTFGFSFPKEKLEVEKQTKD